MASDSRVSDSHGVLIDEGVKLYELPVICRKPGPSGFFDTPFFGTTIGLACAGGTLVYQQVYATLVPIFANLAGNGSSIPSVAGLAAFIGAITAEYVRSLGSRRSAEAAAVSVVVAGHFEGRPPEAFQLKPNTENHPEGLITFTEQALDFTSNRVRAPLNVVRALINDSDVATIGGEVQIGLSNGVGFHRVTTVVPAPGQAPRALQLLNAIDLDSLPPVGPCWPALPGMISP